MTSIDSVGVVGGGLMGAGIAQVSALAGYPTLICEVDATRAASALARITGLLARGVEKGTLTGVDRDGALSRLSTTTDLDQVAGRALIIEAIVENLEAKQGLFRQLDERAQPATIFASNTSSLSIGAMASVTKRADRCVGLHFFSPVPMMQLVEIVRGAATSDATMAAAGAFVERLGKTAITTRDTPGFVVNLLLVPYMLDAARAYERGVASIRDIDVGMRLGANHPIGPLALCDLVGIDVLRDVAETLFDAFREPRYAPPPILTRLIDAGWLGRKTGVGFWRYGSSDPVPNDIS